MKNVKKTHGREGEGFTANVYISSRKIGTFADYARGGLGEIDFVSKKDEEDFAHLVFAYGDKYPDQYILDLLEKKPERLEDEKQRIREYLPFISEKEMTLNALSNDGYGYPVVCTDGIYQCDYKGWAKLHLSPNFVASYAVPSDFVKEA